MADKSSKKITREQQRKDVLQSVLSASFLLFRDRGYKNTTISDISAVTGIHVGSIYNIFSDKEDILCELLIRDNELTIEQISMNMSGIDSLVSDVAYPIAVVFHLASSSPNIAHIISIAYSSSKTVSALTDRQEERMNAYFSAFGRSPDRASVRRRLYAFNGGIGGLVASLRSKSSDDYSDELAVSVEMFCNLFSIPCFNINEIISRTLQLIEQFSPEKYLIGYV